MRTCNARDGGDGLACSGFGSRGKATVAGEVKVIRQEPDADSVGIRSAKSLQLGGVHGGVPGPRAFFKQASPESWMVNPPSHVRRKRGEDAKA